MSPLHERSEITLLRVLVGSQLQAFFSIVSRNKNLLLLDVLPKQKLLGRRLRLRNAISTRVQTCGLILASSSPSSLLVFQSWASIRVARKHFNLHGLRLSEQLSHLVLGRFPPRPSLSQVVQNFTPSIAISDCEVGERQRPRLSVFAFLFVSCLGFAVIGRSGRREHPRGGVVRWFWGCWCGHFRSNSNSTSSSKTVKETKVLRRER